VRRERRPLIERIGYRFAEPALLEDALTHCSAGACNNERLEFLGDGALNFFIAAELYQRKPHFREGELSRLRASLVRGETLADIARRLELGDFLILGSGELKSGGFRRDSILADALEAIIGAIYLDGGFDACRDCVRRLFDQLLDDLPDAQQLKDPKTRLQEYLQGRGLALPDYQLLATSGKAHEQQFRVECRVTELALSAQATASSRRKAEQSAAAALLDGITARETRARADQA